MIRFPAEGRVSDALIEYADEMRCDATVAASQLIADMLRLLPPEQARAVWCFVGQLLDSWWR